WGRGAGGVYCGRRWGRPDAAYPQTLVPGLWFPDFGVHIPGLPPGLWVGGFVGLIGPPQAAPQRVAVTLAPIAIIPRNSASEASVAASSTTARTMIQLLHNKNRT